MRSVIALFLLWCVFIAPAKATEVGIEGRFGPGAHFLSHQPFAKKIVRTTRERKTLASRQHSRKQAHGKLAPVPVERTIPQTHERVWSAVAKPSRYIAGRLICAINVNAALAERGVKGPGGASSKAFLGWGRPSKPMPGAVAFNYRRGGGHVALVSHVDAQGRVWVWNPSPRGRGWQLRVNRYSSVYRVAS